jgi:hypothetical protein
MRTETPLEAKPESGDFKTLRALFGINRSRAYLLKEDGEIRFINMRRRGAKLGRILVDFDSVREYLTRCSKEDQTERDSSK